MTRTIRTTANQPGFIPTTVPRPDTVRVVEPTEELLAAVRDAVGNMLAMMDADGDVRVLPSALCPPGMNPHRTVVWEEADEPGVLNLGVAAGAHPAEAVLVLCQAVNMLRGGTHDAPFQRACNTMVNAYAWARADDVLSVAGSLFAHRNIILRTLSSHTPADTMEGASACWSILCSMADGDVGAFAGAVVVKDSRVSDLLSRLLSAAPVGLPPDTDGAFESVIALTAVFENFTS